MLSDKLKLLLQEKVVQQKNATDKTFEAFELIRQQLSKFEKKIHAEIPELDKRIKVGYTERGKFEVELKVADDVLIFIMHTNTFIFEPSHSIYKTNYVTLKPSRATCGMISVYNFLSDSFKFDRKNDVGQLVARIFVNEENHFFAEGMKQIGILFNDFANMNLTAENIEALIQACVVYSLDIDVHVPPFDAMKQITVYDVITYNMQTAINASSRLGFKYQGENFPES
jgi:hypothetical protein